MIGLFKLRGDAHDFFPAKLGATLSLPLHFLQDLCEAQ